jgi:TonB family protein
MKNSPPIACIVLVFALSAVGQTPAPQVKQAELSTWKTYNIKDEKVSASFPTHPAMTTNNRYRELLRQRLTDRMIGAYADGVVYGIYTYDNPKPRDSFEDFVDRELNGRDTSKVRSVTVGRFAGKEYSFTNNGLDATMWFFAVDDRLYKFTAFGAPADDPGVKQFFSSIIFDRKGEIEVSEGLGILLPELPGGTSVPIFTGRQVDTKARLVMRPEPSYTDEGRQASVTGTVILKVVFASNGAITNIRTVQGIPHGLTEQAIDAARKMKFIPAVKDGKKVSMWMQLEYNFNLY